MEARQQREREAFRHLVTVEIPLLTKRFDDDLLPLLPPGPFDKEKAHKVSAGLAIMHGREISLLKLTLEKIVGYLMVCNGDAKNDTVLTSLEWARQATEAGARFATRCLEASSRPPAAGNSLYFGIFYEEQSVNFVNEIYANLLRVPQIYTVLYTDLKSAMDF